MKGIPLVITYHPLLNLKILPILLEIIFIFSIWIKKLVPITSFRGARKLGSCLVRAKLYPLKRSVESLKWISKRFQACLNVKKITVTLLTRSIKLITNLVATINVSFTCLLVISACFSMQEKLQKSSGLDGITKNEQQKLYEGSKMHAALFNWTFC